MYYIWQVISRKISHMARKTKEDTEKTYHALLDAATAVFSEQGVSNTTLNQIAKAAGMTRGAVYWHFENKDAVIKALWEKHAGVETNKLIQAITNLPPEQPLEFFKTQLKTILKEAFTDPNLNQSMRIINSCKEFTHRESELQQFLRSRRKRIYCAFHDAVSRLQKYGALNPHLQTSFIANGFWIFIVGIMETHLEMDNDEIVSQFEDHIDIFIRAFE